MQRTKIEWTDYVWNPIKGLCPNDCWYCYAKKIYKRFHMYPELYWDGLIPILSNKKSRKIFVCSTMEMFHPDIPRDWRDRIFKIIGMDHNRKHTFQILTKFPHNIDRPMPDNVWLGTTVTNQYDAVNGLFLCEIIKTKIKFVSFEPLFDYPGLPYFKEFDWIIIGRLTGHGNKHDPEKNTIEKIVNFAKAKNIPIFLKDNLRDIWGKPLIQEFPNV